MNIQKKKIYLKLLYLHAYIIWVNQVINMKSTMMCVYINESVHVHVYVYVCTCV